MMTQMPCHHNLDEYLHAYINAAQLTEAKSILFRTALGRTDSYPMGR